MTFGAAKAVLSTEVKGVLIRGVPLVTKIHVYVHMSWHWLPIA